MLRSDGVYDIIPLGEQRFYFISIELKNQRGEVINIAVEYGLILSPKNNGAVALKNFGSAEILPQPSFQKSL